MGAVVADVPQGLVRIFNDRRTLIRPHRGDGLAHIGDLPGIGDHHLIGQIAAQVIELCEHFLRGAQI